METKTVLFAIAEWLEAKKRYEETKKADDASEHVGLFTYSPFYDGNSKPPVIPSADESEMNQKLLYAETALEALVLERAQNTLEKLIQEAQQQRQQRYRGHPLYPEKEE